MGQSGSTLNQGKVPSFKPSELSAGWQLIVSAFAPCSSLVDYLTALPKGCLVTESQVCLAISVRSRRLTLQLSLRPTLLSSKPRNLIKFLIPSELVAPYFKLNLSLLMQAPISYVSHHLRLGGPLSCKEALNLTQKEMYRFTVIQWWSFTTQNN